MRYLVMMLSLCAMLLATDEQEINTLIDDIVNASPQTRYEKMNAFKLKMRELNQEQRRAALEALRAKAYPALDPQRSVPPGTGGPTPLPNNGDGMMQLQLQQQQQQQMLQQQELQKKTQQPRTR